MPIRGLSRARPLRSLSALLQDGKRRSSLLFQGFVRGFPESRPCWCRTCAHGWLSALFMSTAPASSHIFITDFNFVSLMKVWLFVIFPAELVHGYDGVMGHLGSYWHPAAKSAGVIFHCTFKFDKRVSPVVKISFFFSFFFFKWRLFSNLKHLIQLFLVVLLLV